MPRTASPPGTRREHLNNILRDGYIVTGPSYAVRLRHNFPGGGGTGRKGERDGEKKGTTAEPGANKEIVMEHCASSRGQRRTHVDNDRGQQRAPELNTTVLVIYIPAPLTVRE